MAFGSKKDKDEVKLTPAHMQEITKIATDGLVHADMYQISFTKMGDSWGRGKGLDGQLVMMQQAGAEILNVMPFVSGKDGLHVQALIVYRAPMVDDLRPGY